MYNINSVANVTLYCSSCPPSFTLHVSAATGLHQVYFTSRRTTIKCYIYDGVYIIHIEANLGGNRIIIINMLNLIWFILVHHISDSIKDYWRRSMRLINVFSSFLILHPLHVSVGATISRRIYQYIRKLLFECHWSLLIIFYKYFNKFMHIAVIFHNHDTVIMVAVSIDND
jgi:hypothetical protein